MSMPSNLYAGRIYSEHPTGLWPIDDDLSYMSLIADSDRNLLNWSSSATISQYRNFYADSVALPPFHDTGTYRVSGSSGTRTVGTTTYNYTEAISPALFNMYTDLNHEQRVFAINAYLYHWLPAAFYEIGYFYNDGTNDVFFTEQINPGPPGEWIRVGKTFDHTFLNLNAKVFVRVFFETATDIGFMLNGLSVGHWSETQSSRSLGVHATGLSKSTGLPLIFDQDIYAVPLREYGPGLDTGYVITQDNRLLAVNGGIPMVYGSDSVTTLVPSHDTGIKLPSMVVPGKGFLNEFGRYNSYTLEAWIRIDNYASSSRRIIGPVSSTDGIYIRGNTMSMVIGSEFRSFCIGEWYRPMLLHMAVKEGQATLMINGELVASMPINQSRLRLPSNRLYNEDWIGFYAYSDTRVFEVDTVSIFPYVVPTAVAKRRFVWGQGVESPETINAAYLGTPLAVDFAYANYSVNYTLPETMRWDSGVVNNLIATRTYLAPPNYVLPVFEAGRRSMDSVMASSREAWHQVNGPTFMTFNSDKAIDPSYLYFSKFDMLIGKETALYGMFNGTSTWGAPLFILADRQSGVQLRADIEGSQITYSFNGKPYQIAIVDTTKDYAAGINLSKASKEIQLFAANPAGLELYVAGNSDGTFTGRMYRFGICDEQNAEGINWDNDGVLNPLRDLMNFTASYTLMPTESFGRYYLDIATEGTWRQTIPMSYFARSGRLDFLQFNMGAPNSVTVERYMDLASAYPTYQDIANSGLTYGDLIGTSGISTATNAYLTINRIGSRTEPSRTNIIAPNQSGVLDLNQVPDYLTTLFLVTNNTVIVPPDGVSFDDLVLTIELSVKVAGVYTDAFMVKDLSLSSFVGRDEDFFQIGTMHGVDIAPYTKIGNYYTTRIDKPWTIYKRSTPYLYLTNDSGIHPLTSIRDNTESGMWIGLNKNLENEFKVSALQLWIKYTEKEVPSEPTELFAIKSDDVWIRFMGVDDGTGKRVRVYAVNGWTGADFTSIRFHQDGHETLMPYIESEHWSALGIDFEPLLDLGNDVGGICLIAGCVFANIVYYKTSSLQEQYTFAYRTWAKVANNGSQNLTWEYWRNPATNPEGTWDSVAKTATYSHGISIDEIYKTYTGTNRFVVDDPNNTLFFIGDQSSIISSDIVQQSDQWHTRITTTNDPEWTTLVRKPA